MASISKRVLKAGVAWRVYHEFVDRQGERRRTTRQFNTLAEARAYKLELEQHHAAGVRPKRTTLGAYLEDWLVNKVAMGAIRPNTLSGYRSKVRSAIRAIGDRELSDLAADDVEYWLRGLLSGDFSDTGRPLSASTVRQSRTILHGAIGDAVRKRQLPFNVVDAASAPKTGRGSRKPRWTMEHVAQFLAAMDEEHPYYADYFRCIALTGCRRSEAAGLLVPAVDLQSGLLHVERTLIRSSSDGRSEYILSEPKSASSRRSLPIGAALEVVLRRRLQSIRENRLRWGSSYLDGGFVFCEENGQPYRLDTVSATALRLRDQLGLPKASAIHGLRHAYGDALNRNGQSARTIMQLMGHSRSSTSLDLYVVSDDATLRNAASGIDAILGRK